jgi:hypothetical protein
MNQLWMNLDWVNIWFHLGNPFCEVVKKTSTELTTIVSYGSAIQQKNCFLTP